MLNPTLENELSDPSLVLGTLQDLKSLSSSLQSLSISYRLSPDFLKLVSQIRVRVLYLERNLNESHNLEEYLRELRRLRSFLAQ